MKQSEDQNMLVDVSELLVQNIGASESLSFNEKFHFIEFVSKSNLKFEIELFRIEEGIAVLFSNVELKVEHNCDKCISKVTQDLHIDKFESIFYTQKPSSIDDPFDMHMIDLKNKEIDLSEPLRQEIILSAPILLLCKEKCKGLCSSCGQNMNISTCNCKKNLDNTYDKEQNKPFSNLKELLNQ